MKIQLLFGTKTKIISPIDLFYHIFQNIFWIMLYKIGENISEKRIPWIKSENNFLLVIISQKEPVMFPFEQRVKAQDSTSYE